jgi:tetratricopeptide (TPR) repeat protein
MAMAGRLKEAHPDAAYGYELEGDVHAVRGEPGQAVSAYTLAYDRRASATLARKLFHSLRKAGETGAAYEVLNQWLEGQPADIASRSTLARALQSEGEAQQAIEQYLVLLKHDPENVTALNNLAWLLQESGNPDGMRYAERAYELAPDRPEITDTLGWLLVQNGDVNRGLVLLQEARIKAPHIPDIHYHMAFALHKAGRNDEARKELERLIRTGKDFPDLARARALHEQLSN